jgi:HD-like signal output (HDOD) protein
MTPERLSVVFVDDEQKILDGLRRLLRAQRERWDMRFAQSGEAALAMLRERPAEILVADMRMPGMSGGQLLAQARDLYPQTVRMIFSGQTDQAELVRELGCIHQYLQKPCDPEILCRAIERTFHLTRQLARPALRQVANRVTALPPRSSTYAKLVEALEKSQANVSQIADLVCSDPALSVKLMQLVNSAFFGSPRRATNPREAVALLGTKTIHAIVVAARLFDFVNQPGHRHPAVDGLWDSSFTIGESAAKIARANGANEIVQGQARLAGLVSLIGRVILITATTETYAGILERNPAGSSGMSEVELETYGATQEEVAAYALGLWAFSDELIEAVANQAQPAKLPADNANNLVAYLHLARSLHPSSGRGLDDGPAIDMAYITRRGLMALLPEKMRAA